jgi:negative regulator of sigma E activity
VNGLPLNENKKPNSLLFASFESVLARDPALAQLVREFSTSAASLAHTAPAPLPPAALRQRILATITAQAAAEPEDARVLRPSFALFRTLLPWAAAACFALTAAWLGQLYLSARSEAGLLRDTQTLSDLSLKSSQNQLEAERILARRQLADSEKLLVDARAQLTQRDTQLVTVAQRLDTLTGATADLGRQLGESKQRISDLTTRLLAEAQIANVKITALASLLNNSPQALAVAVWNPTKQEGILRVEKLPALASDKDYQLWVVDPQYKDPVDGGVFTVDAQTGEARLVFKVRQPIKDIAAYAITQEVKGGVAKSAGPFLLLGK